MLARCLNCGYVFNKIQDGECCTMCHSNAIDTITEQDAVEWIKWKTKIAVEINNEKLIKELHKLKEEWEKKSS